MGDDAALVAGEAESSRLAGTMRETAAYRSLAGRFEAVDPGDVEAVAAVAQEMLADGAWIAPLLRPLIDALAGDPWVQPPLRISRDAMRCGAQLFDCVAGTLTATVTDARALAALPPSATLVCSGRVVVTRYHRVEGWRLERWRIQAGTDRLVEDKAIALINGVVVRLNGRSHAHQLAVVRARPAAPLVTLSFATRVAVNPREYRRDTGVLVRLGDASEDESRTRMLLALLRLSGRRDAAGCFDQATRGPAFALRWAAMREWLALDPAVALPRLTAMAEDDPHPEVRSAARTTLPLVEAHLCRA